MRGRGLAKMGAVVFGLALPAGWYWCSGRPGGGVETGSPAGPERRELAQAQLDRAMVMRFLFGNLDAGLGESRHPELGIARLTLLEPFHDRGELKQAVCVGLHEVDATGAEVDCHGCGAKSAVFVFARGQEGWFVERYNLSADEGADYGEPSRPKLVEIGPGRHGVLFESGAAFQGQVANVVTLIDLGLPQLPRVLDRLVLRKTIETQGVGRASPEVYEYSAEIEYVAGTNPEHFDIVVREVGGRRAPETAVAPKTLRYAFACDRYVPIEQAGTPRPCPAATPAPSWEPDR